MRLTCPNCDAQYEVPDEVIPTSGRDVQCSNCGQTWFQHHPDHAPPEEEPELENTAPTPDEEVTVPSEYSRDPQRRQLDPTVADILRQEAEAEFEARKQRQSEPLESQPDLGLDAGEEPAAPQPTAAEVQKRALEAKERMARMRGEPAAAAVSSRRELLPDIEEINSTLRNDTTRSGIDPNGPEALGAGGGPKPNKNGFRRGFFAMVLIALVLAVCYLYAPQIAKLVPAVDPFLSAYVTWVDQMRLSLDGQLKSLLSWLDTMASQSAN